VRRIPLTLNIILGVGVGGLVVVDHRDHMEEVVLVELLQSIGKLLHIDLYDSALAPLCLTSQAVCESYRLVPPNLLLRGIGLAADTVCIASRLLEQRHEVGLRVPEDLRK
jgi:hypothetical protein